MSPVTGTANATRIMAVTSAKLVQNTVRPPTMAVTSTKLVHTTVTTARPTTKVLAPNPSTPMPSPKVFFDASEAQTGPMITTVNGYLSQIIQLPQTNNELTNNIMTSLAIVVIVLGVLAILVFIVLIALRTNQAHSSSRTSDEAHGNSDADAPLKGKKPVKVVRIAASESYNNAEVSRVNVIVDFNSKKRPSGDGGNLDTPKIPFSPRDRVIGQRKGSMVPKTEPTNSLTPPTTLTAQAAARKKSAQGDIIAPVIKDIGSPITSKSVNGSSDSLDSPDTEVATPFGTFHYEVIMQWLPRETDELRLKPGDVVTVFQTYEDGWCDGRLDATNELGVFPLACLSVDEWNLFGVPHEGDVVKK